MRKALVPAVIALALGVLMFWQLRGEASIECKVCLNFNGLRRCVTAVGPSEDQARAEAQNNACAQLAKGVTEAVACGKLQPYESACQPPR
jgi:hypothetical protein